MRTHHVAFRTHDLTRLRAFFQELLGLVPVREQAGYSVWLALGDAVLMLERAGADEPAPDPSSRELLALAVEPSRRAALVERLRAGGVPIEEETEYTSYFRDPDGRRIALSSYSLPELEPAEEPAAG